MRKFALYNCNGECYNLNDLKFFMYSPSDLGFKRDTNFIQIGSYFKPYNDNIKQPAPKGVIRFKDPDAYEKYYQFSRFISKTPLTLKYTPGSTTYCLECIISELDKKEIEGSGLHCEIKFVGLGYWYRLHSMEAGIDVEGGKIYDYTYPYTYADSGAGTVSLNVDSNMESPTVIYIYGPVINPTWKHYLNNVIVETGRCEVEIEAGHCLVIDCSGSPFSITEQDAYNHVIYDRYDESDKTTDRFVFLRAGRNRISVAQDGVTIPKLKVEARVLYETV